MSSTSIVFDACPICGHEIVSRESDREVRIGKRSVLLRATLPTCSSCGEVFLSPLEAEALQTRAADTIRNQEGLLLPEEIRDIRMNLGLKQTQLERLIGAGPKTVVRWERGTVFQNGATDNLLRVLRNCPQAVHFLAQRSGVSVTPFTRGHRIASLLSARPVQSSYEYKEARESPRVLMFPPRSSGGEAEWVMLPVSKEAIG